MTSVAVAAATTAVGVLPVFLLGGLAVLMAPELGFGERQLGFAVSSFFGVSALAAAPAGRLGDALGPRRGLRSGAALSMVALVGIGAVAGSYAWLLAFLVVGGVANAVSQMSGNVLLMQASTARHQAKSFAIKQSAVPFANLTGGAMVPLIGLTIGWRWAYLLAAPLALVVLLPLPRPVARGSRRAGRVHTGPLLAVAAGAALSAGAGNASAAFLVTSVTREGIAAGTAGLLLALGGATGIAVRLLAGWARDRFHFDGVLGAAVLIGAGAVGVVTLGWTAWLPLLCVATVFAFGAGWGWAGLLTHAVASSRPSSAGKATGITQSGIFTGGVVGPSAFGLIASTAGFRTAWTVIAMFSVVGAVLLVAGGRRLAAAGTRQTPNTSASLAKCSRDGATPR